DAKAFPLFMPSVFPAIKADTLEELATKMKIDPTKVRETIDTFNKAVKPGQIFDNLKLDGNATAGLTPNKTNWARSVDKPPFYGYPLRPGITFTYLSVKVNDKAQVLMDNGQTAGNLFASGEIMSGNILGKGYLAGFGMTIGTVFGRIAGQEAARRARN
ncbi:MAG TPA: FAD-binding protein, partial [Rhodopila sp.]|nr:FAD-binding protein [Rhodopila sp.]